MQKLFDVAQEGNISGLITLAGILFIFVGLVGGFNRSTVISSRVLRFSLVVAGIIFFITGIHSLQSSTATVETSTSSSPKISIGQTIMLKGEANAGRRKGIEFFRKERYKEAEDAFKNGIRLDPRDPEVRIYNENSKVLSRDSKTFQLAAVVPITNGRGSAESVLRGVADAQKECNINPKNNRYTIVAIADDENDKTQAALVASELVNQQEVIGVIGHLSSSSTKAGLKTYEKKKLAVISPASTSTELKSKVFFRTTPSDAVGGSVIAKYASSNPDIKKIVGVYDRSDPYSNSIWNIFKQEVESDYETSVVAVIDQFPNDNDMEDLIKKIKDKDADTVALFPTTELIKDAASIARKIDSEFQRDILLIGGDSLYDAQTLQQGGMAVEGMVLSVPWFSEEENIYGQQAENTWQGKINWETAMSYDATKAFCAAAAKNIVPNRENVLRDLEDIYLTPDETSGEALTFSQGEVERNSVRVRVAHSSEEGVQTPKGSNYGFKLVKD